jgi:hypothetical protein
VKALRYTKTQINVKMDVELWERLKNFMARNRCKTYAKAIRLLLDLADKKCVDVRDCVCVEPTMEVLS